MTESSDEDLWSPDCRLPMGIRRMSVVFRLLPENLLELPIQIEDWLLWNPEVILMQIVLFVFLLNYFCLTNAAPAQLPTSGNVLWYTSPGAAWASEYLPLGSLVLLTREGLCTYSSLCFSGNGFLGGKWIWRVMICSTVKILHHDQLWCREELERTKWL